MTFRYLTPDSAAGSTNAAQLERIKSLAIPPAWKDVWICPDGRGHLQATGRDARGPQAVSLSPEVARGARRNEVRPHDRLRAGAAEIRRRTDADLRRTGLPREKVLATVVQLLEKTLIRVGNDEYAKQNRRSG